MNRQDEQKTDRDLMERREKQLAAIRATEKIVQLLDECGTVTQEELTAVIFAEIEHLGRN